MSRRHVLLAGASLLLAPLALVGQPAKRVRVGFLAISNEATAQPFVEAFLAGMAEKGYREGNNLVFDLRHARGDIDRIPALAEELVALNPDVLVGLETSTIPIVLLASADPVAAGLVQSLARPGTNVTGLTNRFNQIIEKHIELLSEIAPKVSLVALLNYGPVSPGGAVRYERAARAVGAREDRLRDLDADPLRRLKIDHELESSQLLDRHLGRLFSLHG